jgi:hypothetical protein
MEKQPRCPVDTDNPTGRVRQVVAGKYFDDSGKLIEDP